MQTRAILIRNQFDVKTMC